MKKINCCYLCGSKYSIQVHGKVRDIPEIGIKKCENCSLVYLDTHDHLSDDYYHKEYDKDVFGQWSHQNYLSYSKIDDDRRIKQVLPYVSNKSYLDVGCEAGGVAIHVKKYCNQVSVVEPMKKWQKVLKDRGLEVFGDHSELKGKKYDFISMFHVLEHIADPIGFLTEYKENISEGGLMLIEVPSANDILLKLYESEAFANFTYWSPHLYLFNPNTFSMVVEKSGLKIEAIQQLQRYPLSNHLKWLAKSEGGGHIDWSFIDSPDLMSAYESQLSKMGMCDTLIAWVRKI